MLHALDHVTLRSADLDRTATSRKLEAAFRALEEIVLFAKQRGVEVLLENIPNRLSSAEMLIHFNEVTHLNLNFCFDTGHAHIMDGVEETFELMQSRIRSTHLHDNNGDADLHLPLGAGVIDMPGVVRAIRDSGYDGTITLEVFSGDRRHLEYSRDVLRRLWDSPR